MPDENDLNTADQAPQGDGRTPPTWESVLGGLPEEHKALYEGHTQGLRSALDKERDRRSELEKQVRQVAESAKGEIQAELSKLADQLAEANRQAEFYKEAGNPEIGCTSPELALLAAEKDELFDRRGNVDWQELKGRYPILFKQPTAPRGNAGNGTGTPPSGGPDIDAIIRARAGVR